MTTRLPWEVKDIAFAIYAKRCGLSSSEIGTLISRTGVATSTMMSNVNIVRKGRLIASEQQRVTILRALNLLRDIENGLAQEEKAYWDRRIHKDNHVSKTESVAAPNKQEKLLKVITRLNVSGQLVSENVIKDLYYLADVPYQE